MKYLFSVLPKDGEETAGTWADEGDPVVPQFPHVGTNQWLSASSFEPAPYARVEERDEINVDDYAAVLSAEYPGLPRELHEEYVLTTAKLAHMLPVGSTVRVYITQDTAKVLVIETEEWIELWKQQPLPPRLRRR